jgi:hypothetical protein
MSDQLAYWKSTKTNNKIKTRYSPPSPDMEDQNSQLVRRPIEQRGAGRSFDMFGQDLLMDSS